MAIALLRTDGESALAGLRDKVDIASGASNDEIGAALRFLASDSTR